MSQNDSFKIVLLFAIEMVVLRGVFGEKRPSSFRD